MREVLREEETDKQGFEGQVKSFLSKRKEGILGFPSFQVDGFSASPQEKTPWGIPDPLS